MSCVDTDDIAAIAAVALTQPGHAGHGYILTGPEALTSHEQVATLADVLGREIGFVDTSPKKFADMSVAQGTPQAAADAVENLNELFRAGRCGFLTDDIENVTGVKPGPSGRGVSGTLRTSPESRRQPLTASTSTRRSPTTGWSLESRALEIEEIRIGNECQYILRGCSV